MFKLLKSKKGFTLVELMIVVVIMAILVAVAVPIFSAVTKNAEKRTCLANQREIQSQLSNNAMTKVITLKDGNKLKITTNSKGDGGSWADNGGTEAVSDATINIIKNLFQEAPYCPIEDSYIEVEVSQASLGTTNESEDSFKIVTKCNDKTHVAAAS